MNSLLFTFRLHVAIKNKPFKLFRDMLLSPDVETLRCTTYVVISAMTFKYVNYITQIMGRCGIFHHSVKRAVDVVHKT